MVSTPFEKYANRRIGSFPQFLGWNPASGGATTSDMLKVTFSGRGKRRMKGWGRAWNQQKRGSVGLGEWNGCCLLVWLFVWMFGCLLCCLVVCILRSSFKKKLLSMAKFMPFEAHPKWQSNGRSIPKKPKTLVGFYQKIHIYMYIIWNYW